jgi:hypothetical protein
VGAGRSGVVQAEAVTIKGVGQCREQRILEQVAAVVRLEVCLSAVEERDGTLLRIVTAWIQETVRLLWVTVEPARPALRANVVASGSELAGRTERGEMATLQVHQVEWPGGAQAGEVALLQIGNGDQMLTNCPAEGLDKCARQLFGRVQDSEAAERVVETGAAGLAEVER